MLIIAKMSISIIVIECWNKYDDERCLSWKRSGCCDEFQGSERCSDWSGKVFKTLCGKACGLCSTSMKSFSSNLLRVALEVLK